MNSYEQEIYQYFTNEANFMNMAKIANHALTIKQTLLKEFWIAIEDTILRNPLVTNGQWSLDSYGDVSYNWGKILIHKSIHEERGADNLPIIAVGIQRIVDGQYPFYGVFLNNKTNVFDVESIFKYVRDIPYLKDFAEDGDKWWPKWNPTGLNFRNDEDFLKILPNNRSIAVESISNTLIDLAGQLEREFETIYLMKK